MLFRDWPLHVKMTLLLICASALPLALMSLIDVRETRTQLFNSATQLLSARADHLADQLEIFNRGYLRAARKAASFPIVRKYCAVNGAGRAALLADIRDLFDSQIIADPNLRNIIVLDLDGNQLVSADDPDDGALHLGQEDYVRAALNGQPGMSDVFVAMRGGSEWPTVAYSAPVHDSTGRIIGVVVAWVQAQALWSVTRASVGLAGPGSYAILLDQYGVRIEHTYRGPDILFRPTGVLAPAVYSDLVSRHVFGGNTDALLKDVWPFPEQFKRASAAQPDTRLFRGLGPVVHFYFYGVARRLQTVPWTVFFMIPADSLGQPIARATTERELFAGGTLLVALTLGALFAASILRPIRSLSRTTAALSAGRLDARAQLKRRDELGQLGADFDAMAIRIETQAGLLHAVNKQLEKRVAARTADLQETARRLEQEVQERSRAEVALRDSEQSLATTLHSIGDGVIATDLDGRVVRMNPVAEQLTGWNVAEARGRPLAEVFDIVSEDSGRRVPSPVEHVLRDGVVIGLANHTSLRARDGVARPIADSGAPIRDSTGKLHGVVLVFRDQTDERRTEQMRLKSLELEVLNRQIQEANRLKSEFLANMSHELRTPLNAIIGFTELIHDGHARPDSPQYQEFLGDILTSSRHLLQLINDVLDLSKVEAGKLLFQPQPVDLGELLREVLSILRTTAAAKQIHIDASIEPGATEADLDPARFKQVLYNYLSNAIKFSGERGRVEVRIRLASDASRLRLEVEDHGIGIRTQDLGRLFTEFQQLDANGQYMGTGLGLALTQRLVEAQGGAVGVISEFGRGSVFFAELPRGLGNLHVAQFTA